MLGLKLYEWLTLVGIIAGPIAAVAITLWVESRRRDREQQIQVMRMLLNTRHTPADPAYSVAINLVPVEFNKKPKIMAAWQAYIDTVRYTPAPENEGTHLGITVAKQTTLIFEIMKTLGFNLSESDIQTSAYVSKGWVERDDINIAAMRSWPRIADALEFQTRMLAGEFEAPPSPKARKKRNSNAVLEDKSGGVAA